MTGDAAKAQEAFQDTVREAAVRSARDEPPPDRLWFFRDARWRCLAVGEQGIQAEPGMLEEAEISPIAPTQIEQLGSRSAGRLDFRRARAATQRPGALLSG